MTENVTSLAAYLDHVRAQIVERGFVLQASFYPPEGYGYMHTIGLTPAGLPELVVYDMRPELAWLGKRVLSHLAREAFVEELQLDRAYSVGLADNQLVRVYDLPEDPELPLSVCHHIYGSSFRLLTAKPVRQ